MGKLEMNFPWTTCPAPLRQCGPISSSSIAKGGKRHCFATGWRNVSKQKFISRASGKALVNQRDLTAPAQRNAQEIDHSLALLDAHDGQQASSSAARGDVQSALN